MSLWPIELAPEAEREFREAFLWYFERNPRAADAFRSEVFAGVDAIAENPELWAVDTDGVRRYVLTRFPYALLYDLHEGVVTVLAIGHQRRLPGYWRVR